MTAGSVLGAGGRGISAGCWAGLSQTSKRKAKAGRRAGPAGAGERAGPAQVLKGPLGRVPHRHITSPADMWDGNRPCQSRGCRRPVDLGRPVLPAGEGVDVEDPHLDRFAWSEPLTVWDESQRVSGSEGVQLV